MWYLIVSIPDLCTITYFVLKKIVINWKLELNEIKKVIK